MMSEEKDAEQRATVLRHLARSLAGAVSTFEKSAGDNLRTFPDYKKARAAYLEIQAMIFTIQDKAGEAKGRGGGFGVPADLDSWLIRTRLRAIASFTRLSYAFFKDPPVLLVKALGAHEILEQERDAFLNVLKHYDMMLLEAALDDKTSEELDRVRTDMERTVELLEKLLDTAPPPLVTFG